MLKFVSTKILYLSFLVLISACVSQKKLNYLQDPVIDHSFYEIKDKAFVSIKPQDELFIKVSSFDDVSFNFFASQSEYNRMGFSNELSLNLISYTVNDSGYIYFPILGYIHLEGLSLDEARGNLSEELKDYFNQPTVIVKYAFKKVTVIGQVNNPGNFTYTTDRINIFEALSLAGDMNVHGNRHEVILLRVVNDTVQKNEIDLTNDHLLFSQNFYVQPNDIIYVKSRNSLTWNIVSVPITLVFSTITTALLILNYL
jgi:polysaccharide export outer membrane protein